MARAKRFSDVRRMLFRKLVNVPDSDLEILRDQLWDRIIEREFMRGYSMVTIAERQPKRDEARHIESAIRRRLRAKS